MRNKKTMLLSLLVFVLVGCGESTSEKEVSKSENSDSVVVALQQGSEPAEGLNPIYGWGTGTNPLIQSTLVEFDSKFNIVNDLATSYENIDDGYTWNFTIRDDATFTDGKPVTVDDVKFTFDQAMQSDSLVDLTNVKDVSIESNKKVMIKLKKPQRTFLNAVATLGIVPEHAYDEHYGEKPIGSGPYKFVEWKKGEQIILERNEDYYRDLPDIKQAVFVFMDEDSAYTAAKAGKVDVAVVTPFNVSKEVTGMKLKVLKTQDNRGITMPLSPANSGETEDGYPIGNDVTSELSIRKALAYGIDRKEMAENTVEGYASPAFSENDGTAWNNKEGIIQTDKPKAKKILKDDGWIEGKDGILEKDGKKAEFDMYYVAGDSIREAISNDVVTQAKELGIKVNIIGSNWDDITPKMFSNAVMMGWGSSNPYTSYSLFHSDNKLKTDFYNVEGYDNPVVDQYLEAALAAPTQDEMYENFKKAQWDGKTGTSMLGEVPWIWLLNIDHLYYVNEKLDIGEQPSHIHGASYPVIQNLKEWKWTDSSD
ncbi:ABC transporter substrate-binding protein [Vagococcus jeotgali]|uniref:ABC transporter substrate-binding protein n=1 Tax=Vagococcus jeotgali TaxID=3109030 RepID=UPI002DD85ED0|nr:ABC transporter substrate-binding protein [Vagococcus sp. B2T-5]